MVGVASADLRGTSSSEYKFPIIWENPPLIHYHLSKLVTIYVYSKLVELPETLFGLLCRSLIKYYKKHFQIETKFGIKKPIPPKFFKS